MKTFEFKLPSGKTVKIRECTGLDELSAQRKFIGRPEEEKVYQPWEIIAKCVIEIDSEKVKGYEDLLKLTTKDLSALLIIHQNINVPSEAELKEIRSFFPNI